LANHIVYGALLVCFCAALNLLGLRLFSRILNTFTISKLLPLIILVALLPFIINPHFTITSTELSLVPLSLPMAIFGYFGFEYCCSMSHLIVDSEKNGPRAIMIGFLGTALIYALFHFGVLNLMGVDNLVNFGAPAFADFITLPIGPVINFLKILIPLAASLTLFAGANGMISANAILLQTMAEDRLIKFAYPLSRLSRWYRPFVAIFVQSIVVFLIIVFIPHVGIVGGICNMGILSAFILPFVSLFILQKNAQSYRKLLLTVLALAITLTLVTYSFYSIADAMTERILYTLPLIGALIAGLFLFERTIQY
jgi:amino acid transporter